MGGVVDDIVNPIGAITGIDPVKDATGFTGTDMGMTKAQKAAAAQQKAGGGAAPVSGGGGAAQKSNGDAMQALVGQNFAKQQAALQPQAQAPMGSMFGNQLAALHQQITAPPAALPAVASPSATQLAADVTAQAVNSKIQDPMRKAQDAQSMRAFPSMYAPR